MEINREPNVVPLCDILLVLLIIFMLITPMAQVGLDIQLPDRGGDGNYGAIILNIQSDRLITVNDEPYENQLLLEKRLRDIYDKRGNKTIFVKASRAITYQKLIDTMDIIKLVGVDNICVVPSPGEDDSHLPVAIPVYERKTPRT